MGDNDPGHGRLTSLVDDLVADLGAVARVEVRRGPAHETHPPHPSNDDPWDVIDDPKQLRVLVAELAQIDLFPQVVVPALPGVSLVCFDTDGQFLATVDLLSSRWVRCHWPYDGLLAGPILTDVLRRLPPPVWDSNLDGALDQVEPVLAAAARPGQPDLEHARPGPDAPTLCGIPATQVLTYRHIFRFTRDDCPDCTRLIWDHPEAFRHRRPAKVHPMGRSLTALWQHRWPGTRPISYELRSSDHWVRFHTLPGSKRYPDTESEYAEIARRHRCLLRELSDHHAPTDNQVFVVTCSWSAGPTPTPRTAPVAAFSPQAIHWQSILTDDSDPRSPSWTHLFLDQLELADQRLDQLLGLVADDRAEGVLIADPQLQWMYAPYDGGTDILTATTAQRDALKARHPSWLSPRSDGL